MRLVNCSMQALVPHTLVEGQHSDPSLSLKGMQLQGAVFDGQALHECSKETASWTSVDKLGVAFKRADEPERQKRKQAHVPLYQDGTRQTFLLTLHIECANDLVADLSGVCCALNS